jgi:hypothetical protein
VANKKRSSRSSRRSSTARRHGNTGGGDFDSHKYVMTLQEAHAYLGAAIEGARRSHNDWQSLRTSVWRLSQALAEIQKVERQLGRKGTGVQADIRDLDELVNEMAKA